MPAHRLDPVRSFAEPALQLRRGLAHQSAVVGMQADGVALLEHKPHRRGAHAVDVSVDQEKAGMRALGPQQVQQGGCCGHVRPIVECTRDISSK